jgi:hypothetical protein
MMRSVFIALLLLLGSIIVFAACLNEKDVKLTFVNSSDSLLCFELSSAGAAEGDICDEVQPRGTTVWRPGCSPSGEKPLTVALTVRPERRQIYDRTATCNEWEDAQATFIIKQSGDELVVSDSLPDGSPSP